MTQYMPTFLDDLSENPLSGAQMELIRLDIERGVDPREAIAKHVAVGNFPLPRHRPVFVQVLITESPFVENVLVGYQLE